MINTRTKIDFIKIATWNAGGITVTKVESLYEWIRQETFDVILLQEIKGAKMNLPGYVSIAAKGDTKS